MQIVHSKAAPGAIGAYSQAIREGNLLFLSGQGGLTADGTVIPGGFAAQFEQTMRNIEAVLRAAGGDFSDVIKTNCFLTDMADYEVFNECYARYFPVETARTCYAAPHLPRGIRYEMEVVACLKEDVR